MKPGVSISKIKFNDDSEIDLGDNQILLIIGPNNSGKSLTLKEINYLTETTKNTKVIKELYLRKSGSNDDITSLIKSISIQIDSQPLNYQGYKYSIWENGIVQLWSQQLHLGAIHNLFINLLTTEERLNISNPPGNIRLTKSPPQHPIHFLQKDDELENKFSEYFKKAFGIDLVVHRNAGNEVPLYVGKKPIPKDGEDRVSINYIKELEGLDPLHEQGDGMRSFIGVLLNTFITDYSLILIDEPEAFLHPPQARLLGRMLTQDLPANKQLILATHSSDFIRGMLDTDTSRLKIVRMVREGNINKTSILDHTQVEAIWNDPLIRHSNIIDGVFHTSVIICEGDADCRFYSAISDSISEKDKQNPDVLFIHCGGKHRISTVAKALNGLNVVVKIIVDFDVLENENPIRNIYEVQGGKWNEIKKYWELVNTAVSSKRPELETDELKKQIISIIDGVTTNIFPKNEIERISILFKKASAWSYAKTVGKSFIPSGDATKNFDELNLKLKEKHIYILENGELESFDKTIGNHGPKWVNEVLKKDIKKDTSLEDARNFIKGIVNI